MAKSCSESAGTLPSDTWSTVQDIPIARPDGKQDFLDTVKWGLLGSIAVFRVLKGSNQWKWEWAMLGALWFGLPNYFTKHQYLCCLLLHFNHYFNSPSNKITGYHLSGNYDVMLWFLARPVIHVCKDCFMRCYLYQTLRKGPCVSVKLQQMCIISMSR